MDESLTTLCHLVEWNHQIASVSSEKRIAVSPHRHDVA
jgi:hypothetical protein